MKIKPCPFCGSTGVGSVSMYTIGKKTLWQTRCLDCGARGPNNLLDMKIIDSKAGEFRTDYVSAVAELTGWNTRKETE